MQEMVQKTVQQWDAAAPPAGALRTRLILSEVIPGRDAQRRWG